MQRIHHSTIAAAVLLAVLSSNVAAAVRYVWLDELDVSKMEAGRGEPKRNASVEGRPLSIGGRKFERGVGTHAHSVMWIKMDGWTSHFTAFVGVDDEVGKSPASVEFIVFGKGQVLWQSGIMKAGDPPKEVNVLTRGVKKLGLIVTDGGDGNSHDHADWADAKLRVTGQDPPGHVFGGRGTVHPDAEAAADTADQRARRFRCAAGLARAVYDTGHGRSPYDVRGGESAHWIVAR